MATRDELAPIIDNVQEYMRLTGFDREKANRILCLFAGVDSLYELKPNEVESVARYMQEVISYAKAVRFE